MKWFIAWLKMRKNWMFLWIFTVGLMCVFMCFYNVPIKDIAYSVLIVAVFGGSLITGECISLYSKQRELNKMLGSVMYLVDGLPETEDITEETYRQLLKKQQEFYEDKLLLMKKKEQDMEEYYSMWAHQIKTPIAAMRLLLQTKELDEKELEGELFRIEQYVDMVMQYIRLEGEGNDFVIQKQALDGIIRESIRKYAKQFIRKKIRLEYEGTDCEVTTDKKWLCFVIEQLLSNAVKYTAKGSVTITVRSENAGEKANVVLEIADTGIGIAKEDIPRVCEKGYTGYNGREEAHSSGIGLFLTKQMLTKLGHGFVIESEKGCGTKVRISFSE